tara:strand:- start:300 stop:527 length:228 start_codon:yes stop_codon:yes gene_type:complete
MKDKNGKEYSPEDIVGILTLNSMLFNYAEIADEKGTERADQAMQTLWPEIWPKLQERIWQWYDQDYQPETLEVKI